MKVAVYSAHHYEKEYLRKANTNQHTLLLFDAQLTRDTVAMAQGCKAVSIFVNDDASTIVLNELKAAGILYLALRSAGYNHVNLTEALRLGMKVARVPEYSPAAIAEHTVALMLALNRKLVKAHNHVRELNFSLEGLVGFDMKGKTAGIIGTGKIGRAVAAILHGFGCRLLVVDQRKDPAWAKSLDATYTTLEKLCTESDIITLHVPLNEQSKYVINKTTINIMKKGVMLINTGRGGLINTRHVILGLKSGQIGYLGMDVYEEEQGLFFEDHSEDILQDDVIARLMTFQNVLITSHQAFLTHEALLMRLVDLIFTRKSFFPAVQVVNRGL